MRETLTKQQLAAVESRGRSLLVSAAAGSGKTKVLVERLFSYVEHDGADLDDFLIITYTRAAASELRGKIARALSERLESRPDDRHLQRQLLRLYRADIKTVDAFCTALLRENCHLLGEDEQHHSLRPDFRVLDEQDASVLQERVLGRVLDRFYEGLRPGDGGMLLADTLGAGRDDSALAELVLELHKKLQAQPFEQEWLAQQDAFWRSAPQHVEDTPYGALLLRAVRRKARHWALLLRRAAAEMDQNAALAAHYAPSFAAAADDLDALCEAAGRGWDAARACEVTFPRLGVVKDADGGGLKVRMKSLWDACKASSKKLGDWLDASSAEAAEDLRAMAPAMCALIALTGEFSRAYQSEKRRRNAADFSDQEHEAIRLLIGADGAPTELAHTVSQRYREIMVDEYQDTNEVQNRIFEAISREGKNLFTVGDVKQSIYRFRLADPRIFLRHYRDYPPEAEAAEGESAKLLLSRNFRSRREVLQATNFIFSNILSVEMGELEYGADERLYAGASYEDSDRCAAEFHLVDLPTQSGEQRVRAPEAEAGFVADYIAQMLSSKFPVQDERSRELRPVRQEDIVILMRSPNTRMAAFRRALESRGLRCAAAPGDDFYATMEIAVTFALLQIIDNPRNDVPLIAALRSPIFGFTPDRLAQLRAAKRDGDFYDALACDEGEDTRAFLALLAQLREDAQVMNVHELLASIYERCNVLGVFGAMPGGEERRENLLAFLRQAKEFDEAGYRGLFSFVSHLRELLESGNAAAPVAPRAGGGVRIMSIHKSKGLEFPVVILCDLARRFSDQDYKASVLVHPQLGLGPVCVDRARRIRYPTVARRALERTLRREDKAEELRLLYVAMTRAKEKLVLVHTMANAASRIKELLTVTSCPVLPEVIDERGCMGDWVMLPLLCRAEAEPLRALAGLDATQIVEDGDTPWVTAVHDGLSHIKAPERAAQPAEETGGELRLDRAALEYVYPYETETHMPAKLTATQLKGRALDDEIAEDAPPPLPPRLRTLGKPRFLSGEHGLTGAERGTAIHLAMQYLDFTGPATVEAVRTQVAQMLERRLLTPEQAEAVDLRAIARFLQSDVAARIRSSDSVRREYRFSILYPAQAVDAAARSGDEVLLQGVVDCFFEENGELVVLDFKTDHITHAQLAERREHYRPQLESYAAALERIMGMRVKEKLLYFFSIGECSAL